MKVLPNITASPKRAPALWLLVFVTLSGTLGMHMFVPALADAARELGTSTGAMQLTITLYIIGLGVGQLIYGPLSDAFGRRGLLLGGLAVYAVAGLLAALSQNIHFLVFARLLQALGGCAGMVLGRVIIRDTTTGDGSIRKLAMLNLILVLSPGLAPIIGGLTTAYLGWRYIFVLLGAIGLFTFLCCAKWLPETTVPTGHISARILWNDYRTLLRSRSFVGFALGGSCGTTAFYGFLAAAPFIFQTDLHRPVEQLGFYLALLLGGLLLGNALTSRLIQIFPLEKILLTSNILSIVSASAFLTVSLMGQLSVSTLIGLMFCFTLGTGITSPLSMTRAISVDAHITGSAAGIYGFLQMAIGAACTLLVSFGSDPAISAAWVLASMSAVSRIAFLAALKN
ncbi:MAG: multidrug effflux MFS transporter [Pseudomonadota bacterium]